MKSPRLRFLFIFALCAPLAACGGDGASNSGSPSRPLPPEVTQCATCHSFDKDGPRRSGPNLYDVIGKPAASVADFKYSAAIQKAGIIWTEDELHAYLESPRTAVPGTRMMFSGEADAAKRQTIIDFMKQQTPAP